MLKNIQITLYEIFGYLLPGIILLTAISIFFWTFLSDLTPPILYQLKFEYWMLILLISYFLGHIAQALANVVDEILCLNENFVFLKKNKEKLPDIIVQEAKSKITQILGIDLEYKIRDEKIRNEWLFRICDKIVVQYGSIENRELYVYREGFYRGSIISFFVLFLSLLFLSMKMLIHCKTINLCDSLHPINWLVIYILAFISLVGAIFFFFRCRRFIMHHVRQALLDFLILCRSENFSIKSKKEREKYLNPFLDF